MLRISRMFKRYWRKRRKENLASALAGSASGLLAYCLMREGTIMQMLLHDVPASAVMGMPRHEQVMRNWRRLIRYQDFKIQQKENSKNG